jgi:hypothetical protein
LLKELPLSIGNLTRLERLNVGHNMLQALPQTTGRLRNLKQLRLSGNRLRELPNIVMFLPALEQLILDHNELIEIPTSVGKLKSLKELVVSYNLLHDLPISITRISSLEKLDVTNNPNLKRLPPELLRANIKNLALHDARSGSPKMSIGSMRVKGSSSALNGDAAVPDLARDSPFREAVVAMNRQATSGSPSKPRMIAAGYVASARVSSDYLQFLTSLVLDRMPSRLSRV